MHHRRAYMKAEQWEPYREIVIQLYKKHHTYGKTAMSLRKKYKDLKAVSKSTSFSGDQVRVAINRWGDKDLIPKDTESEGDLPTNNQALHQQNGQAYAAGSNDNALDPFISPINQQVSRQVAGQKRS